MILCTGLISNNGHEDLLTPYSFGLSQKSIHQLYSSKDKCSFILSIACLNSVTLGLSKSGSTVPGTPEMKNKISWFVHICIKSVQKRSLIDKKNKKPYQQYFETKC